MEFDIIWPTKLLEFVLAGAGVLGVIYAAGRKVYRIASNIEKLLADVKANTAITAQAVVDVGDVRKEQMEIRTELAHIKAEVKPNGGSSMRDAINRIDSRTDALEKVVYGSLHRS